MYTRQQKPKKVIGIVAISLVLILLIGTVQVFRPLPAIEITATALPNQQMLAQPLAWPKDGESAVEIQGVANMLTSGKQQIIPTASIAKLITCLTVLQVKPLNLGEIGPPITLTQSDLDIYNDYLAKGGSVVNVAPGEIINEYQALQAMLLPSANNIADSLAIWAYGSLSAYKAAATQYLEQQGLNSTTIGSDASGLSPDTTSTPTDIVHLGELAMANPVIAQIVAQSSATIPIQGTIHNADYLLGKDGIIGIKTGNNNQVRGNFVFAASDTVASGKTVTIVCAIMNQGSLSEALNDALPLIDSVKANLYITTPIQAGQTIATYHAPWGATATAVAAKQLSFVAWKGTPIAPRVSLQRTNLDYTKGAAMGTIAAMGGTASGSTNIILTSTITSPAIRWRLTRH